MSVASTALNAAGYGRPGSAGTWIYGPGMTKYNTKWASRTIYAIFWDGSKYITNVDSGANSTSTDGITWSLYFNTLAISWRTLLYNDVGVWDGIANNGSDIILVSNSFISKSTDGGINWSPNSTGRGSRTGLWTTSWYDGQSDSIYGIIYANSNFVVFGSIGKVATSTDGVTWTYRSGLRTAWTSGTCYAMAWDGTKFVAVGDSGKVATSTDAITWTNRTGLSSTAWGTTVCYDIVWNGTQFVVVGASGKVATSTDGITWTNRTGLSTTGWGSTDYCTRIKWNGSQYVVVGSSGKVATSTDAITWTYQTGLSTTTWGSSADSIVYSLNWNGSKYIVGGKDGRLATSTDGVTWTFRSQLYDDYYTNFDPPDTSVSVVWVTYGSGQYVIGGRSGLIGTSPDGYNFTYQSGLSATTWSTNDVATIIWNGTQYLAMGTAGAVATSTDAVTWTYRSSLSSTTWGASDAAAVVWTGSQYYAVATDASSAYSTDGITWTYNDGANNLYNTLLTATCINWNGTQYLVGGASGEIATSSDGITWTARTTGLTSTSWGTADIGGIEWTGSKYVIVGGAYSVATSTDGITWTYSNSLQTFYTANQWNVDFALLRLGWNGTLFITLGAYGQIATSKDGVTWTIIGYGGGAKKLNSEYYDCSCINWNGKRFFTVFPNGTQSYEAVFNGTYYLSPY